MTNNNFASSNTDAISLIPAFSMHINFVENSIEIWMN